MTINAQILSVLIIDDLDKSELLPGNGAYYTVEQIKTAPDVSRLLTGRNEAPLFHIFLVDVNMCESQTPELRWFDEQLRLYGPLLVLPFLSNSSILCTFQAYSSYWKLSKVHTDGYLVVSMSLVYSRVNNEIVDLRTAKNKVKHEGKGRTISNVSDALIEAVGSLRAAISDGDIRMFDVQKTRDELSLILGNGGRVDVPFKGGDGSQLAVTVSDGKSYESIQLASLFLDVLEFKNPLDLSCPNDEGRLESILRVLESWTNKSVPLGPYTGAIDALQVIQTSNVAIRTAGINALTAGGNTDAYWDAIREEQKKLVQDGVTVRADMIDECHLSRLVFLFAWVGVHKEGVVDTSDVYPALGIGKDTYANPRTAYVRAVRRLFGGCGSRDKPDDWIISDEEKHACRLYAHAQLGWTAANEYPDWMELTKADCRQRIFKQARKEAKGLFGPGKDHDAANWCPEDSRLKRVGGEIVKIARVGEALPFVAKSLSIEKTIHLAVVTSVLDWCKGGDVPKQYCVDIGDGAKCQDDIPRVVHFLEGLRELGVVVNSEGHGTARGAAWELVETGNGYRLELTVRFATGSKFEKNAEGLAQAFAGRNGGGSLTRAIDKIRSSVNSRRWGFKLLNTCECTLWFSATPIA